MALARWGALVVLACVVHACHAETNTTNATNTSAAPTTPAFVDAKICEEGGEGTFFPAIEDEYKWSRGTKIVLYFLGMIWGFAGVGILADTFMTAIEHITAKESVELDEQGNQTFIKVWNPTVANLTLMALGSSAPEILLSLTDTIGAKKFYAGALGPSTIVGSAAFNLLVIIAVCTYSLEDYKRISQYEVYLVTAICSVFAYVWLLIILAGISPDIIQPWEAVVTLLFFPILVGVCYMLDARKCCFQTGKGQEAGDPLDLKQREQERVIMIDRIENTDGTTENVGFRQRANDDKVNRDIHHQLVRVRQGLQTTTSDDLEERPLTDDEKEELKKLLIEKQATKGQSRAAYRVQADKRLKGKKMEMVTETRGVEEVFDDTPKHLPPPPQFNPQDDTSMGYVTFAKDKAELLEGGSDAALRMPSGNAAVYLALHRIGAGKNAPDMHVRWATKGNTATSDKDFVAEEDGLVVFGAGESQKIISVEIIDDDIFETDEIFHVRLLDEDDEENNAKQRRSSSFAPSLEDSKAMQKSLSQSKIIGDVGAIIRQVDVTILNDDDMKTFSDRMTHLLNFNSHRFSLGKDHWKDQFIDELSFPAAEETIYTKLIFIILLPFAFCNALCPPVSIGGGWPCFGMSLAFVGLITACIGDIASLFGCSLGISDEITAITFVALGTSLPDTFASKTAALNEDDADAAITNVTGSNSVNVFLGLGLSWTVASFYWMFAPDAKKAEWRLRYPDQVEDWPDTAFYMPAGNLVFSVTVFTCCSLVAFAVLHIQRVYLPPGDYEEGGELGGPRGKVVAVFFVFMWLLYIVLSSLKSEGIIS